MKRPMYLRICQKVRDAKRKLEELSNLKRGRCEIPYFGKRFSVSNGMQGSVYAISW